MDNTRIDWADMTWNPVTGCRNGCHYCYAARMARRCGNIDGGGGLYIMDEPMKTATADGKYVPAIYPFGFSPTFHRYRLDQPARKKRPRNIFVCSMADLFGDWVPTRWIVEVLDACLAATQHNYLFLTKNPERYVRLDKLALLPRRHNFWYGTTTTKEGDPYFFSDFHNTFVSVEPMMGPMRPGSDGILVDWVIVGAETGPRADKVTPERAWVEDLLGACREEGVPIFMKGNLAGVWGEELIQELPKALKKRGGAVCARRSETERL